MTDPVTQLPESLDTNKAISLSLGMASPLWLAFAGAAVAGSAFWWMSRWTRPENLEAMFELPATTPASEAVAETAAAVEPVAKIAVTAAEAAIDVAANEAAAMAEGLADVDPVVETLAELTAAADVTPVNDDAPVAAVVETAVAAAEKAADDLTKLVGIGPKLAASLADLGVTRFSEIAAWGPKELADFNAKLDLKGRAERDAWVAQAKRLATGS
jgi:predicted flap endonuclease-1-like 5' DNA nuclease